jgi:predicted nucleic acid-binding protein
MKVVLDTNVLISGIYFGGLPGKILEAWGARQFQLLVSTESIQEYLNVAERLADRYPGVEPTCRGA